MVTRPASFAAAPAAAWSSRASLRALLLRNCLCGLLFSVIPVAVFADEPKPPPLPAPTLIDEIVAIVNDRAILRQDVYLEARIALAKEAGPAALTGHIDGKELAATLDRLIDQLVLFEEANRLQVSVVPASEVDGAVRELRAAIGEKVFDEYLSRKQVDPASIREIVERGLRVRRYLNGRFKAATKPKDTEVSDWFASHKEEYAGRPLAEVADSISDRLARDRYDAAVATYTTEVRHRAQVRILSDPGAPASDLRNSGRANSTGPVDAGKAD